MELIITKILSFNQSTLTLIRSIRINRNIINISNISCTGRLPMPREAKKVGGDLLRGRRNLEANPNVADTYMHMYCVNHL